MKDVRTRGAGGGGVSQKRTHADAGGGGSVAKSGRPQIQNFTKIFEIQIVPCVLEITFDLTANYFDVSELFIVRSNSY